MYFLLYIHKMHINYIIVAGVGQRDYWSLIIDHYICWSLHHIDWCAQAISRPSTKWLFRTWVQTFTGSLTLEDGWGEKSLRKLRTEKASNSNKLAVEIYQYIQNDTHNFINLISSWTNYTTFTLVSVTLPSVSSKRTGQTTNMRAIWNWFGVNLLETDMVRVWSLLS